MRAWNKTDSSILVILLLAAVALGWYYPSIPSEVPSHYGLDGKESGCLLSQSISVGDLWYSRLTPTYTLLCG